MPPHASHTLPPRPVRRTFCPARLAAAVLAQAYELLLPGTRRPLPLPAPPTPTVTGVASRATRA